VGKPVPRETEAVPRKQVGKHRSWSNQITEMSYKESRGQLGPGERDGETGAHPSPLPIPEVRDDLLLCKK
jgi:hypothetical protein